MLSLILGGQFQGKRRWVHDLPHAQQAIFIDWLKYAEHQRTSDIKSSWESDLSWLDHEIAKARMTVPQQHWFSRQISALDGDQPWLTFLKRSRFTQRRTAAERPIVIEQTMPFLYQHRMDEQGGSDQSQLQQWCTAFLDWLQLQGHREIYLILDEVNSGLIPVLASQRAFREIYGRFLGALSKYAHQIIRLFAGIPQYFQPSDCAQSVAIEWLLIRHGETQWNTERRYLGQTDLPLSDEGRTQLIQLCQLDQYPPLDDCVASPLKRCIQTANLIYPNQPIRRDDRLIERHFGVFEGKTFEHLKSDPVYMNWLTGWGQGAIEHGESQADVHRRLCPALEDVMAQAVQSLDVLHQDQTAKRPYRVGLICHGGIMMEIMSLLGFTDYYRWQVANGTLIKIPFDRKGQLLNLPPIVIGKTVFRQV